ncbi:MAG: hypothetical protein ACFFFO_07020 [Candidatus Thorarchaeota archaeon]
MPKAQAHIRMSSGVAVDVSCVFEVISNETLNASLAFVYPEYWHGYGGGYIEINFTIHINSTLVNHKILTWENLTSQGFITEPGNFGGTWIESADFVQFVYEMQANATYLIRVQTQAFPLSSINYGHFSYIIGSARTFTGVTHQTVEIFVENEIGFESFSFYQAQHLVESSNASGSVANWDFVIDDTLNFSTVGTSFTFNEYRGLKPPFPDPYQILTVVLSAVVLISLVLILVWRRYTK